MDFSVSYNDEKDICIINGAFDYIDRSFKYKYIKGRKVSRKGARRTIHYNKSGNVSSFTNPYIHGKIIYQYHYEKGLIARIDTISNSTLDGSSTKGQIRIKYKKFSNGKIKKATIHWPKNWPGDTITYTFNKKGLVISESTSGYKTKYVYKYNPKGQVSEVREYLNGEPRSKAVVNYGKKKGSYKEGNRIFYIDGQPICSYEIMYKDATLGVYKD